ncbi:MAG: radical SAM family heme chaperone HemW [Clostridiales bacterium]|jgi:oxygen-independent coproporphyrinogen-3 oxidase|nr:radical SAM family heme chaperone HemW [Clostridiales bacterium]
MPGLYIHIPFCRKKCGYCAFYSAENTEKIDGYIDALAREAEIFGAAMRGFVFDTAYLGGGTPSLLSPKNFEKIFGAMYKNFSFKAGAEISVEGNPSDFCGENKVKFLRAAGVNRLSVGIQTMNGETLKKIGRIQTEQNNLLALEKISETFDNFSADVMIGLPGEGIREVEKTLKSILKFDAKHISAYALKVEENTPLHKTVKNGEVEIPSDDDAADAYDFTLDFLKARGIERYEISNFARKNYRCEHNLNYWKRGEYLGLGAAAHSFLRGVRFENQRGLDTYTESLKRGEGAAFYAEEIVSGGAGLEKAKNNSGIETEEKPGGAGLEKAKNNRVNETENISGGVGSGEKTAFKFEKITPKDALFEKIMLGFRLKEGINIAETEMEFGVNFLEKYRGVLDVYGKCFDFKDGNIAVKDNYFYIVNSLIEKFM